MEEAGIQSDRRDLELQHHLQQKLEKIQSAEGEIPAVIIVHNVRTMEVVYMSERGVRILGFTLEQIRKMGAEYNHYFFNPEDAKDYIPKIMGLLERNREEEMVTFFQQVRPSPKHEWTWYLSSIRILLRGSDGQPAYTITTAIPIDQQHYFTSKVERLLQENNFLRCNKQIFASLSKREREILRFMALGHNSTEIAAALFISETTAKTHRRNIRRKLNAQTNYDITRFAQAFDLI